MPFRLYEDFKVCDERHGAYSIDIEETSSLSHGHACVTDGGQYHVLLNSNKHFINAPQLRNFRLEMDLSLLVFEMRFCGFILYFRHDRRTGMGHSLKCEWDNDFTFRIFLNANCVYTQKNKELPDFSALKTILSVNEKSVAFEFAGQKHSFECADVSGLPEKGAVGFDVLWCRGTMLVSRLQLDSDDDLPKTRLGKTIDFELQCVQGFSEPLRYKLDFHRYATGEVELEYTLDGTIRGRGARMETGGNSWGAENEKLTRPYIRLESAGSEFANILVSNSMMILLDKAKKTLQAFPYIEWPLKRNIVFRDFPERFTAAAGYEYAIHSPWRFLANGPYEAIKDQDNRMIYEGDSLRRNAVGLQVKSPEDKRITTLIPKDIPMYERARRHAARQHYFFASEDVVFTITVFFRSACHDPGELSCETLLTDPYGDPLDANGGGLVESEAEKHEGGFESRSYKLKIGRNPGCGVYHLEIKVRAGHAVMRESRIVFEVLSDDPAGPCPALASRLPFMLSMPNEIKYLETDAFDPWSDYGGGAHYYSAVMRYPVVGKSLGIWELLRIYRRKWLLMITRRNHDNLDMDAPENLALIRHADFVDCHDLSLIGGMYQSNRYDLYTKSYYKNKQLDILKDFIREKKPPLKLLTCEALEKPESKGGIITNELFDDLFAAAWDDWCAYFRSRIEGPIQSFVDKLLKIKPNLARGSYGPVPVYVSHYKSAYTLKYSGYIVEKDPRLRANGSFWFLEEYHYSCDYPLTRGSYFVASYDLYYSYGRYIYPEIYYGGGLGCLDGAVYQAHPPHGIYDLSPCHQRRIVYQYTYGTPQFKDGKYKYWKDYGFHVRTPGPEDLQEFISAWGNLIKNEPARHLKAPFIMLDFEQIGLHGDYNEDEYSVKMPELPAHTDVCNTAEEALGYTYEQLCKNGYNTPVLSKFEELPAITPNMAEFIVLPPIVEGTPRKYMEAIRAAHERGINLLCFETAHGLEDIFGIKKRADGAVKLCELPGETFAHKCAVAHYDADGAEALLCGSSAIGAEKNIPVVFVNITRHGKAVFVNIPPTVVRRESFREKNNHGQDTISQCLMRAMRDVFARLTEDPDVRTERGAINACYSTNNDLIVTLSEDSPIYRDTTTYPTLFRFSVRSPGIENAVIETAAPYSVITKRGDFIAIRTETRKDDALFFRFRQPRLP